MVSLARAADEGSLSARPLAPHAGPQAATLFVPLSPEQTGIVTENRFADPKMWGVLYQEFEGGSIGTGVTIGDYDGDGRADLFVVAKTETCRLFRNLGDYKFEDVTEKAGVLDRGPAAMVWKSGATFVDVNNDGRLDLYVCRFDAPNLLYVNQGDGTFKEQAAAYRLDVKDASVMACFADYDRDGWLDVYIVTNMLNSTAHPKGQRGILLHSNRDGTYSDVSEHAGIEGEAQSHSATWWDFDNDGWLDLYVTNDYGVPDKLYRNNHDGTFTDAVDRALPHTSHYSMGSDIGDVNNDGLIDFVSTDMEPTTHFKDQNSIAGAREKLADPPDWVATSPKYMRTALYLNTGLGRCLEASYLAGIAASDWTWSARLEDLDNDGWVDCFVTNGFNRDPNPDTHQKSMSAESTAERIRILRSAPVLAEVNLAFRNLGHLEFKNVAAEWGLDEKGVSFGTALGDFGGDGNLDIVYSNSERGVTFLHNTGTRGHRLVVDLRGTVSNRFGVGAIVRIESALGVQVRQLALARGYMSSSEPALFFGLGDDTVVRRLTVTWPSGHTQTFENVSADQRLTITEPAAPAPQPPPDLPPPPAGWFAETSASAGLALRSREEPVNELSTQKLLPVRLNRRGPALAVGAIDASGRDAVVVGGTTVQALQVLRRNDAGGYARAESSALPATAEINDGPVLLFDADGDSANDLLVTKGGNSLPAGVPQYQPHLYLNDGSGGFRAAPDDALPPLPFNVGAAAAADYDRDGRLDVFLGGRVLTGDYPLEPASALLANRGGRFEDVTDTLAPGLRQVGMVTAALWSDVDGDGWLDLLLTLEWGTVKCFHNRPGAGFEDWSEQLGFAAAGTGWWTSLTAADFNGDAQPDYVVGNVGLNTPYRATAERPTVLFSGDFKGDGSSQLIEGLYEGDKLYPRRARLALAASIPSVLKKYPRNDPYARATLAEILGADKLAAARRFAATELRSGVFLSQRDGTYRFAPLPRPAQIAPLQGMVAGDFDGDGHADIYAVQNSYAPNATIGRFDGGVSQLLRGDGAGGFSLVPVLESGLLVPGDAKALAVLDLDDDGRPDFLATRNNTTALAFRDQLPADRHFLRIALRGAAGNPTAVGARVTVELADGTAQTSEIYAGSGYYSQSTAAAFFGYRTANAPKRVTVRWPDGAVSRHEIHGESRLVLNAPGR